MSTPQEILNVECPDCAAPIGEECSEWHVARARAADAAREASPELFEQVRRESALGVTPSPSVPDDPTRTREAIERRIESLLAWDYDGDEATEKLCREAAGMARRYHFGDYHANLWLLLAERAAYLSDLLHGDYS